MENVWAAHLTQLRDSDQARSLGIVMALAAEVMTLKAEVKRLQIALNDKNVLSHEAELDAGDGAAFRAWLQREQGEFTAALLKAWVETDEAPDVSAIVAAEAAIKD